MHQRAAIRAKARLHEIEPALPVQEVAHFDKAHDIIAVGAYFSEAAAQQADDQQAGHHHNRKE